MGRLDRYILSQLLTLFGFFSLVLVLVYWINRAVVLFDRLIASGHSAGVFLEFTALSLPNVIRLVLPVSAFAAAVYVTNRLRAESELAAAQAAGASPWRLARPVAAFGVVTALLIGVLTHHLVPASKRLLTERTAEISEDLTAGLLVDGRFLHPADGVTFYIREITPRTELRDVFLEDASDPARRSTYTAERALLLRSEAGPRLVMFDGMVQTLGRADRTLATTRFSEFAFDISALVSIDAAGPREADEASTRELLIASPALRDETGEDRAALRFEAHERFTQAAVALATPLVGFAVMMLGAHSRFGVWRQVLGAILCLIAIELASNLADGVARDRAGLWFVAYLPTLGGIGFAAALLALQSGAARRGRGAPAPA